MGSGVGSGSGGGVGSKACIGALGSSGESRGAARRPLKDVGKADAVELDWGMEKGSLAVESGGLKTLPELAVTAPLDKSVPVQSSVGFCTDAPKLNCAAPFPRPSPLSPKLNVAAVGLAEASLASSPWPTRSPEKLPKVSPPIALGGWGSTLRAGVVEDGLTGSLDMLGGGVREPVPRAGEVDLGVRENVSSPVWPNTILPPPLKENLLTSFTGDQEERLRERKTMTDQNIQI